MAYFKIGSTDYSNYVMGLKVQKKHTYTQQTNALGDSVVDYITSKRVIEVEIRPLLSADMASLMNSISFSNTISFRDTDGTLKTISTILPDNAVEYYTIQSNKVLYKKAKLKFQEL